MRILQLLTLSVYSDDNFSIKYASKLTDLIEYTSGNIVLNLSNNWRAGRTHDYWCEFFNS